MKKILFFRLISALESKSLIGELWEYFVDKYFTPHYGDYEHINLGSSSMVSLQTIVFAFFIGINIAAVMSVFDKRVLGDFARTLIRDEALSSDRAKTLMELGYFKNTAIRSSLRSGHTLRRVVKCVEEEEYYASLEQKRQEIEASGQKFKSVPFKIDFETAHFYIPEQLKYTAEIKFEKKGTNWLTVAGVFVASLLLMIGVFWIFPDILQMLDNFLSMF